MKKFADLVDEKLVDLVDKKVKGSRPDNKIQSPRSPRSAPIDKGLTRHSGAPSEGEEGIWGRTWKWLTGQLTVGPGEDKSASARCPRAPIFDPKLGHGWVRADGPAVRGPVGSACWVLVFWLVCPVGQIRTRSVRLGRPAGDALTKVLRATRNQTKFLLLPNEPIFPAMTGTR
jgi:hypothetical protein